MKMLETNSTLYRIVGCAMTVYNNLKSGYLESVYEKALEFELLEAGFLVRLQVRVPVFYCGVDLKRDCILDMIVDSSVVVELKAVSSLRREHEAQVRNYLKATGYTEGLLINFGNMRRLEWRRVTL